MDVKETRDVAGFAFGQARAKGQPPKSASNTVTVGGVSYTPTMTSEGVQVRSGGIALIRALPDPHMPAMAIQLTSAPVPPSPGDVQWSMTLSYSAPAISYSNTYQGNSTLGQPWDITAAIANAPSSNGGGIVGGNAVVNWTYGNASGSFSFRIRGENPGRDAIVAYMESIGEPWFGYRVGRHETAMKQFCPIPVDNSTGCGVSTNEGLPLLGPPSGYGILQYDPPASTHDTDLLWNWKSNVSRHLTDKIDDNGGWNFWTLQISQWQAFNLNAATQIAPPSDRQEGSNCTFTFSAVTIPASSLTSPGPYWFGDAVDMKRLGGVALPTWSSAYNIYPNHLADYISWNKVSDSNNPYWLRVPENTVNSSIVQDFCNSLP